MARIGEPIHVELSNAARFDEVVHTGLPEGGDLEIVCKEGATTGGRPCVAITFTVQLPSGELRRVQAVTTLRLFIGAAEALAARHARVL